jgi:hypothetical protein
MSDDHALFLKEFDYINSNLDYDIDCAILNKEEFVDYSVNRRVAQEVKATLVSCGYFATLHDTWLSRLLSKYITVRVQV